MTPEERDNLKPYARLEGDIPSKNSFLAGLGARGLVVLREPNKVLVRWEDGEERWYDLDDPRLLRVRYVGPSQPDDPPWLPPKPVKRPRKRR